MSDDQEQLLSRAVSGDEDALSELLNQHAPRLARQLRVQSRFLSKLDVDDVLQVTFLEAFLNIHRFDPDRPGSFSGWLARIADCNLSDMVRELQRAKRPSPDRQTTSAADTSCTTLLNMLTTDSATPSRRVAAAEAEQVLKQTIAELPADYGKVVELCDLAGRSVKDVAQIMGRSPGAVYMLRARAHDHLREALGNESRFFSSGA
jgi:RNA polymerase sigma factor (sigma-70 family)